MADENEAGGGWIILGRKLNEEILIGDSIRIKIMSTHGTNIKVGIQAPKKMRVLRGEIAAKIVEQNCAVVQDGYFNTTKKGK